MSVVQPVLFGDCDRAEEQRRRENQPRTCPACGTTEPTGWLLRNNHGVEWETGTIGGYPIDQHPIFQGRCVAQDLKRNHIWYALTTGADFTRDANRARELGLDVDAIVTEWKESQ